MAHTFQYENTIFICDGDPRRGLVRIRKRSPEGEVIGAIELSYDDIAAFVAEQTRRRLVDKLERADDQAILTGEWILTKD